MDYKKVNNICISAVIPTYNRETTIARALESALAQEYPASEIIVVDDGSKDNTKEIVKSYGEKVRYLYQNNTGVAAARNRGFNEAKHEWIAFLDSDDYWFPQYLKRMTDVMRVTEERAALYFSDIRRPMEDGGGSYWDLCNFKIKGDYELKWDASEWALLARQPMTTPTTIISRKRIYDIGGIPETLVTGEDTFLFYKLCFAFPVCAVSGYGGAMTSDGGKGSRLTAVFDGYSSTYHECSKMIYKEILRDSSKMNSGHRKEIENRLVWAYLDFSRVLLQGKHFGRAAANIAGAVQVSPLISVKIIIGMLKSYCGRRFGISN